ncbi:squalene/phytoene synthase family protein, partial [Halobium palmae]
MVSHRQLRRSKSIQQRTGKTFHLATRFLPKRVRHPTYVLYAFFRLADEVVDDPDGDLTPAQQRARLRAFRERALGRTERRTG